MNWIVWSIWAACSVYSFRRTVLHLQDGADRIAAGAPMRDDPNTTATKNNTNTWDEFGAIQLIASTLFAPAVVAFRLGKKLLFPRGIKSEFAREQERLLAEQQVFFDNERRERETEQAMRQLQAWDPGEYIESGAPINPALLQLEAAAQFAEAEKVLRATAGQDWVKPPYKVTDHRR